MLKDMQYRVGIDKLRIGLSFKDKTAPFYRNMIRMMKWVGVTKANIGSALVNGKKFHFWRSKPPVALTSASRPLFLGGDLEVRYGRHMHAARGWIRMNGSNGDPGELHSHFVKMFDDGFDTL